MKAIFINGSPHKNWSTYKMLKSAMEGGETELVNLYDYDFNGYWRCFACRHLK